ncbi:hypothetical protein [Limobrevibacterium gyesilva]|uniref:Uncharacterized protein n=1 Tax=Limobrevibacterium gyesilva TaxID=2991712 RepID=A0AA41YQ74_9PROT|nr:hypothetical protein [Limobrevibacterium gyesilva]MCW3477669.1 hypothetical protein [Limobrevibacterium gyesilva]
MTTNVTVQANVSSQILVPFTSAANAAAAQAALNAVNSLVIGGSLEQYVPTAGSGPIPNVPTPDFLGGVVDTVPASLNFGVLPNEYVSFVNGGTGLAVAIGGPLTKVVVSGADSSLLYVNQSTHGQVFLGGGNNYIANAFSTSKMAVNVDGSDSLFGSASVVDVSTGAATVNVFNHALVDIETGNATSSGTGHVVVQPGTAGVMVTGSSTVPVTVSGTAGSTTYFMANGSNGGGGAFINPGAGDIVVFPGGTSSATLFGGTKVFGDQTITGAAFTGSATVGGASGYYEGGSAGHNLLKSSTVAGATTLVGGGDGDILFVSGAHDVAVTGSGQNVIIATDSTVNGGATYGVSGGTGTVLGAQSGHNSFFLGSGNYTLAGFHDVGSGTFAGSVYNILSATVGGAGNFTIVDFLPSLVSGSTTVSYDKVELGGLTATISTSGANSTAVLSDGTTITFQNAHVTNFGTYLA